MLILSCKTQILNRRRRLTVLPDYTSGYSLDTSPFQSYIPRIPKSISGLRTTYPQSALNTIYNGYKDSQDFNVGYSLSLDSGKNTNPQQSLINLGYSDVITGSPKQYATKYTSIGQPQKLIESPRTQNYYAAHTNNDNIKNGIWKTVSPNVEIFQSKEIHLNGNDLSSKSTNFDHQKALGRSQGFDYTNVIENQQAGLKQIGFDSNVISRPSYSNTDLTSYQATDLTASQNQPQYDYTPSKSLQQINAAFQNTPKFPLDTHLLKEAGLTPTEGDTKAANGEVLPVHIDTSVIDKFKVDTESYIQTAMRQNTANTQLTPQFQSQFASAYQTQQYQNQPYQFQNQINHQQQQQFAPRPQQFGQGSKNLVNFNDQKMLHFDNNDSNNFNNNNNNNNLNSYANIQKQHGFRNGRYGLDNTLSQSFGGIKSNFNYPVNNFRNIRESSYNNNIDLKPPPIVRPRYRTKNKRFH